ncbi:hypothetical protein M1146_08035 [Patescibacteria group bacterium]|nr:hypothetical protein [Patescibacteria group bacterium]
MGQVGNPASLAITSRSFDGAVKKAVNFVAGASGLNFFGTSSFSALMTDFILSSLSKPPLLY